jgi:hypothetical protein
MLVLQNDTNSTQLGLNQAYAGALNEPGDTHGQPVSLTYTPSNSLPCPEHAADFAATTLLLLLPLCWCVSAAWAHGRPPAQHGTAWDSRGLEHGMQQGQSRSLLLVLDRLNSLQVVKPAFPHSHCVFDSYCYNNSACSNDAASVTAPYPEDQHHLCFRFICRLH